MRATRAGTGGGLVSWPGGDLARPVAVRGVASAVTRVVGREVTSPARRSAVRAAERAVDRAVGRTEGRTGRALTWASSWRPRAFLAARSTAFALALAAAAAARALPALRAVRSVPAPAMADRAVALLTRSSDCGRSRAWAWAAPSPIRAAQPKARMIRRIASRSGFVPGRQFELRNRRPIGRRHTDWIGPQRKLLEQLRGRRAPVPRRRRLVQRQFDGEAGSGARHAVHLDRATVGRDQGGDDRQPEPCPSLGPGTGRSAR